MSNSIISFRDVTGYYLNIKTLTLTKPEETYMKNQNPQK
jgi:hypothetical protein